MWGSARGETLATPIDQLFALQQIDIELRRMRLELEELARSAADTRGLVDDKRPVVLARRHQMAEMERHRREIEAKLADDEEKMKDRRMRMQRIRSEKELAALRREIDLMKEQGGLLEEELLGILENGDTKTSELKVLEEELSALEATLREKEQQHAERSQALRAEIEQRRSDRSGLAAALDESLRRRYELIFERKNGLAVVEIQEGDCSGCRMRVPPQLITQVHRNTEVVFCPACHRILYHSPKRP
ncbi:MAG: zinc ribbon domain-containing protein [Candidatus Binatia bacterium]